MYNTHNQCNLKQAAALSLVPFPMGTVITLTEDNGMTEQSRTRNLEPHSSGPRGFLSVRLGTTIVAVVITGLLVFVACFLVWHHLGGGAWRSEVSVKSALLISPDRLELIVASCHGAPRVSLEETDVDVQVKVISFSTPLRGGMDCLDTVQGHLREPLGDRIVVDKHTGQSVTVRIVDSP